MSRLQAALAAAGDLTYEWDLRSDAILWRGPVVAALALACPTAVATGRALAGRVNPADLAHRQQLLNLHLDGGGTFDCEYRLRGGDGRFTRVHDRGEAEFDADGRPVRIFGVMRVMTVRKGQELCIRPALGLDESSADLNRHRLGEVVEESLAEACRLGRSGAYLVIGIDNMTTINDAFGPAAGDIVIAEVGQRLTQSLRGGEGVLGRVAGDRFGAVLADCPEERIPDVAERLLATTSELPIFTAAGPVYLTLSIGGIAFPRQAATAQDVMTRCEAALVDAKRAGRDCFAAYRLTEEHRREHRASMAVGARVQRALKQNRLLFAFQPVVCSDTGAVDYYECLLRLREEDGTIVAAGQFVPLIEQLGFIRSIDRFVLDRAIEELADSVGFNLGINISGLTAADQPWLRSFVAMLRGAPRLAERLVIEITETAALRDLKESARFVTRLRDLGCRVALDDFGAGFTSLRHLQELGADTVKIDGSFVRNLVGRPENQAFLRHLVGLTGGLGLKTVAECVETEQEAAILTQEGVDFLQGYHFGRPNIERPWQAAEAKVLDIAERPRAQLRSAS